MDGDMMKEIGDGPQNLDSGVKSWMVRSMSKTLVEEEGIESDEVSLLRKDLVFWWGMYDVRTKERDRLQEKLEKLLLAGR